MIHTFVIPCWYNVATIKKHKVNLTGVALDSFNQTLNTLDKVIWSPDNGRYNTGMYLGLSSSGKSGRVILFTHSKYSNKSYTEIIQVSPERLFKIDWSDDLLTQELIDIRSRLVEQIEGGTNVITVT